VRDKKEKELPGKPASKTLELIKKITSQASTNIEDEETLKKRREEQEDRLKQIKQMMDEEKKAKA